VTQSGRPRAGPASATDCPALSTLQLTLWTGSSEVPTEGCHRPGDGFRQGARPAGGRSASVSGLSLPLLP
jgi:hypothetical protein